MVSGIEAHAADSAPGFAHDDVNVMCIGAKIAGPWLASDLISSYLSAESSIDEDFRRWVEKLHLMDAEG